MKDDERAELLTELAALSRRNLEIVARLGEPKVEVVVDGNGPTYSSYAASVIDSRRLLKRYVPGAFFGDPASDMMLDLFVAAERGEERPVKCCCLAANIPPTTALRYLDMMEAAGLITRVPDTVDHRRTLVALTESAIEGMRSWLAAICSIPLRRELPPCHL